MIAPLMTNQQDAFAAACRFDRVFGSKCLCAFQAYGPDSAKASFFLETAGGTPAAALYLSEGVLTVSSKGRSDPASLAKLIRREAVDEVDTNWELCAALHQLLGGNTESSWYMEYASGQKPEGDFSGISPADESHLPEIFEVLGQSHEYYRTHYRFEPWAEDLKLRMRKNLTELCLLRRDGRTIGTGSIASEDESAGAIAAVAVIPEFRHRGLGGAITSYLTQRLLDRQKLPVLISGYDEVASLYRKLGFKETGRWGELYL